MAVTKEQLARWNKNFEDKYPEKKSSQTTTATARQVSDAQMNQWERGYQTMQKSRTAGTSTRQAGNMEAKLSGDAELAKLDKATVRAGQLTVTDSEGNKLDAAALYRNEDAERRNLLEEVDKHLTDYDRAWMEAYKKANAQMSGYINETSMLLSGTKKATTENYIHINVDSDTNPEQNKGIRYDNSAANPSFLNHRVNSGKPVVLVGLVQQAMTNIENTAQYAGMAIPLRNAEKILNSMQGGKTLFRTIEDNWGTAARSYMNKALADLCEVKDSRQVGDGVFAKLRSYAAAAALNANVNVTLLQAASLPTSAAELGWGATGSAFVQFNKNLFDPRNVGRFLGADIDSSLTKIEKRMAEHGDELLAYRLRGTGTGEMASANAQKGFLGRSHDAARNSENKAVRGVTKAADKVISLWTGGITKMDEITVAACWQGSESYVKAHPEEFGAGAEVVNSPEYWAAVNEKFQQVVEHTQPNYTTMQRTGLQRSGNEIPERGHGGSESGHGEAGRHGGSREHPGEQDVRTDEEAAAAVRATGDGSGEGDQRRQLGKAQRTGGPDDRRDTADLWGRVERCARLRGESSGRTEQRTVEVRERIRQGQQHLCRAAGRRGRRQQRERTGGVRPAGGGWQEAIQCEK